MEKQIPEIEDEEFIRLFEAEDDSYLDYCDLENMQQPGLEKRTVAFDLRKPDYDSLVEQAAVAGVTLQQLVATWVAEKVAA
ncbi:MAG: BrnA antitoxin family protein [Cellulomonadaceae bacterium]|jgi:hypothetical protein|nr:BrnA antitoxin family protein [Cellulomonadaceae bacterium]